MQAKLEAFKRLRMQHYQEDEESEDSEEVKEPRTKRPKVTDSDIMPPPSNPRENVTIKDGMLVLDRNAFDFVRTPSKDAFLSPYAGGGRRGSSNTKNKESGR